MRSGRCWPRVTAPACEPRTPDDRTEDSMDQRPLVTPRDRVVAAYKGSFADRVPAYPIAGSFAGCLDGLSIEEYCTNPTKAVRAMLNYYERYQPDIMIAFNDLAKEAEAIGCHVKYSDYVVPSIDQHVLQDDKGKLARLEVPDPYRDGRLPAFLEQCQALSAARFPSALGAVLVGPCWSGRGRSPCSCAIPSSCAWTRSTIPSSSTSSCVSRPSTPSASATPSSRRRSGCPTPIRPRRARWSGPTPIASSSSPTTRRWSTTSRPRRSAPRSTSAAPPTRSTRTWWTSASWPSPSTSTSRAIRS